jgi:hypothetical protein
MAIEDCGRAQPYPHPAGLAEGGKAAKSNLLLFKEGSGGGWGTNEQKAAVLKSNMTRRTKP